MKMTPAVFVVLLVSLSGTVAEGEVNTSKPDSKLDIIIDTIVGKNFVFQNNIVVPGDPFSNPSYDRETYYDRIIDWSLQQLMVVNHGFSMGVSIKEPELYHFEMPVEGLVVFDGLLSIRRSPYYHFIKRFENGDHDLRFRFYFDKISGIGNFSGFNSQKEIKNYFFDFQGTLSEVQVLFMMTKEETRKRVTFKFDEPPAYNHSLTDINVALLLEQQISIAFNRLFNDLYSAIYERVILTLRTEDPSFDKVLDGVFNKLSQDVRPAEYENERSITNQTGHTVEGYFNATLYGLHSLTRMSPVKVIKEINGDHELQTMIKIGNVTGNAHISGIAPDITVEETFVFTSPPVVVEALFYLPLNESVADNTFHFLTKPNYTIVLQNEDFRRSFEKVLEHHSHFMYETAIMNILNETLNVMFPLRTNARYQD